MVQSGFGFTTTIVVAGLLTHPLLFVTMREYVPAMARVAFGRDGFWTLLVKPLGPVQE
jgi:hypothetical protein